MENTYDSKMDRGGNSGGGERLNRLCTQSGQDGNRGVWTTRQVICVTVKAAI